MSDELNDPILYRRVYDLARAARDRPDWPPDGGVRYDPGWPDEVRDQVARDRQLRHLAVLVMMALGDADHPTAGMSADFMLAILDVVAGRGPRR